MEPVRVQLEDGGMIEITDHGMSVTLGEKSDALIDVKALDKIRSGLRDMIKQYLSMPSSFYELAERVAENADPQTGSLSDSQRDDVREMFTLMPGALRVEAKRHIRSEMTQAVTDMKLQRARTLLEVKNLIHNWR